VPPPIVVRNVRIVDGTGAPATAPRDLLIERGRIVRIAPAGTLDAGPAEELDGEGGWVMPGLMDLHAHVYLPELLPAFLQFGVTLVRDQGSAIAPLAAYRDAIAAGVIAGPRVTLGAFQFYTDWPFDDEQGRGIEPEADSGHVARALDLAAAFGADHVKTRTFRRWDINARIVREAHRRGMRVTGHCVLPLPLVAAGIDAKEHAGACAVRGAADYFGDIVQYADADGLIAAAGIGVVPTISYFALAARLGPDGRLVTSDAEVMPFVPGMESFGWMLGLDSADRAGFARATQEARDATARLAALGTTIGAGTDIWQLPTGVHLELEELVAAGLSPAAAIRAATGDAARIIGAEAEVGTIAVGQRADLVLLDADPLADIRNTRRIRAVVMDGRLVQRP
jgi:imidazolonepropionase-like amidohydrolase